MLITREKNTSNKKCRFLFLYWLPLETSPAFETESPIPLSWPIFHRTGNISKEKKSES